MVEVENITQNTLHFPKDKIVRVLDLRSLGFFKVNYCELVRKLENQFKFNHYCRLLIPEKQEEKHKYMKAKVVNTNQDPFPWLEPDDIRRHQSDTQILREKVDLKGSFLSPREKERLMQMIFKYKTAFSLRDEIGECPNIEAEIKIIDDSPFFVRPFKISETDQRFMDRQMERLVALGILTKASTSHTSPVMLITRKVTNDKRPVVDFRLLNTRILRRNTSIPLMSDVLSTLGNSICEAFSCLDLKDAYHSIPLSEASKEYCGILPYFGSEVLPMGIACAPQIWMDYVNMMLDGLEDKAKYIAIMDDLLIHSLKKDHWKLLERFFQAVTKHGLKLSPKKCQLFKTRLTYMRNDFIINNRVMTITPLKSRTEAIQKIPTPKTAKDCKSFCGVVNYLSLFCESLQKLLKPIHELTKKGMPFFWGKAQEEAFQEIKKRMSKPPLLYLPKSSGRFILYSDTSREHTGSSLWQIQEGTPRLLGYSSKTLPPACKNYSVTELEMTGLLVNIGIWKHLLKRCEFDAAVDHAAVVQIMKAKTEPATPRIMRLLERLAAYSFNLYFVKGKDMVLADYLSRHRICDDNPNDLTTRSQAKKNGEQVPEIHGIDKGLDPHLKPEHQDRNKGIPKGDAQRKSTDIRARPPSKPNQMIARKLISRSIRTLLPKKHTTSKEVEKEDLPPALEPTLDPTLHTASKPLMPDHEEYRPSTKAYKGPFSLEPELDPGTDTGSPDSEQLLNPVHKIPIDSDFVIPPALNKQIDPHKIIHKFLPKQGEIDRLLKHINRKVLRDIHLCCSLKDLKAAYLSSLHFKDIYLYLLQNKVPLSPRAVRRLQVNANNYMILDGLLFKIGSESEEEPSVVLCIPTSKVDVLLLYYHSSIFGGHVGITKCYKTIGQRFYCPNLAEYLRAYITGCHTCQLFKKGKNFDRPFQKRINLNIPAMTKLSMDIKQMPHCNGYSHILVLLCEVSNFIVALPLRNTQIPQILNTFQRGYLPYFGPPTHIICDQDPAFTSSLMEAFYSSFNIKLLTVSVTNHKSLLAEHGIKSLSSLLVTHLAEVWSWYNCLPYAMMCYNSYSTPNLDNFSPYKLVFGHKMTLFPHLELKPEVVVSDTFTAYYQKLKKNLQYMCQRLQQFRDRRTLI